VVTKPSRARASAPRKGTKTGTVLVLADFRLNRRVAAYQTRLAGVLKANRKALGRLFSTGALFTKHGTRSGRDLLIAHEHLLRVSALLARLQNEGDVPAPTAMHHVEAVFAELDALLTQTAALATETGALLEELKPR
jgi:hypothetical protein